MEKEKQFSLTQDISPDSSANSASPRLLNYPGYKIFQQEMTASQKTTKYQPQYFGSRTVLFLLLSVAIAVARIFGLGLVPTSVFPFLPITSVMSSVQPAIAIFQLWKNTNGELCCMVMGTAGLICTPQ